MALQNQPNYATLLLVIAICACENQIFISLQQYPPSTHGTDGGPAFVRVSNSDNLSKRVFRIQE
eukprot:4774842-Pleurochrysis_carterae.AAC.1